MLLTSAALLKLNVPPGWCQMSKRVGITDIYYKFLDSFLFSNNHFHMMAHIFFSSSHIIHMC